MPNRLFYLLAISLLLPVSVQADGGLYLKGYGGINYTAKTDFESIDALSVLDGSEAEYDTGQAFGLALGYRMNNGLALELDYSYRSNDLDSIDISSLEISGDLASTAIMVDLVYIPKPSSLLSPYLGIGLGVLQEIDADLEINSELFSNFEDSGAAWQVFAGLSVSVLENLNVFSELRFFSGPGPELSNELGSVDLDYNNLSLLFGLYFHLN